MTDTTITLPADKFALAELLRDSLQDAWDAFVGDTGCHPDDIEVAGTGATRELSASFGRGNFLLFAAQNLAAMADGLAPTGPAPTGLEPGEIVAVPADLRDDPNGVQWEAQFTPWRWLPVDSVMWTDYETRRVCRPIQDGDPR